MAVNITSLYHRSRDEIYWVLGDMVEYDNWYWRNLNPLNESKPQQKEVSLELIGFLSNIWR